jgi:hypothetical protein
MNFKRLAIFAKRFHMPVHIPIAVLLRHLPGDHEADSATPQCQKEFRISVQNGEVAVDVFTDVIPDIDLPDSYELQPNPSLNLNQKFKKI